MKSPAVKYVLGPLRRVLQRLPERNMLLVLSLFVGIACGLASVLLKEAIEWIHHGLTSWFGPEVTFNYLYLIYPGIGMLIAMLFVRHVIKDNIGHGVTKVLLAVSKNESKIRPHNMWSSLLASSVTIGFGGSVGAEAPIVYTGAAIGSNMARYMGMSYKNMTILLGCGAAGGTSPGCPRPARRWQRGSARRGGASRLGRFGRFGRRRWRSRCASG